MTDREILELIEAVLQPNYEIDDAVAAFGDIEEDSVPNTITLTPKNEGHRQVILEHLTLEGAPEGERLFAGITIRFTEPFVMPFERFEEKYGPPERGRPMKPYQPFPFRFVLENYPIDGDLILYAHTDRETHDRRVEMMKLLRHPD